MIKTFFEKYVSISSEAACDIALGDGVLQFKKESSKQKMDGMQSNLLVHQKKCIRSQPYLFVCMFMCLSPTLSSILCTV